MISPNSDIQQRLRRIERSLDLVGSLLVPIDISDGVKKAVTLIDIDPDMALGRARKVLDFIISDLYKREFEKPPGTQPLENLIQQLSKAGRLPRTMVAYANSVRELGNVGIHGTGEAITQEDVVASLENLMRLVAWYCDQVRIGEEKTKADTKPEGEINLNSPTLKDANAHYKLGESLKNRDDFDGAIAEYREAIRIKADDADTHHALGYVLGRKGDKDGEIAEYREAIRLNPYHKGARWNLLIVLRNKDDLDGAIATCRELIRTKPDDANAYYYLGLSLYEHGDLDGAVAAFRECLRQPAWRADADVHHQLGTVLRAKGDLDGAVVEFREATRLDPTVWRRKELGDALKDKGDLDGAIAEYREAIRLNPKDAVAHQNLSNALKAKGEG